MDNVGQSQHGQAKMRPVDDGGHGAQGDDDDDDAMTDDEPDSCYHSFLYILSVDRRDDDDKAVTPLLMKTFVFLLMSLTPQSRSSYISKN